MTAPPPSGWQPYQPGQPPYDPAGYGASPNIGHQSANFPGPWPLQQASPPPKGNLTKWLLIAIALLLVVGVTIGGTLLFTRDGGSGSAANPSDEASGFASVSDTGPISIITEEPTCSAYIPINDSLVKVRDQGWGESRKTLGPTSSWTPEQQSMVESVATATSNAVNRISPLASQTPHRVVRELYEQFVSYARAYVSSIRDYQPSDDYLASVTVGIGGALTAICTSISNGAASRSIAVDSSETPSNPASPAGISNPERFLAANDAQCGPWEKMDTQMAQDLDNWSKVDSNLSAAEWTPEQLQVQNDAVDVMSTLADEATATARRSNNPVLEDFGTLSGLYFKAYALVGSTYVPADSWLSSAALRLLNTITDACRAVAA